MTVRSTLLAAWVAPSTAAATIFTVPTGWRAILKGLVYDNYTTGTTTLAVVMTHSATGLQIVLVSTTINQNTSSSWSGWVVLNPGDYLSVVPGLSGMRVWASGTLLQLTGGEPM